MTREELVENWFSLTRDRMPALSSRHGWPVRFDHCFQRILLDNAVGARWSEQIRSPAYCNADDEVLRRAIALGESAIAGEEDLARLNANSLAWRARN